VVATAQDALTLTCRPRRARDGASIESSISSTIPLRSRINGPAREERTYLPQMSRRVVDAQSFLSEPLTRPFQSDFRQLQEPFKIRELTVLPKKACAHEVVMKYKQPRQSTKVLKVLKIRVTLKILKVDHVIHYYRIIHFVQFVRYGYHPGPDNAIYPPSC
jgi:hypothetical protein